MTEPISVILGAFIGGAFGLLGAVGASLLAYRSAEKKRADDLRVAAQQRTNDLRIADSKRADELFSTALEFLGGGTQRRNLGIAAIDLYWREFPEYKRICAEMLIGSAIYLLTESKQEAKSHELFNLHRIMALLKELSTEVENLEGFRRLYSSVNDRLKGLTDKELEDRDESQRGLWVTKGDLVAWKDWIGNIC